MCILFAASSGVIGATESVVGLLTIPIMLRYGYDKGLISGTICAGGSLGTIIPPSVVAVVIGPLADVSVGDILYGMTLPGLVMAGLYLSLHRHALCTQPGVRAGDPAVAGRPEHRAEAVDHLQEPGAAGDPDLRGARLHPARLGLAHRGGGHRRHRFRGAHDPVRQFRLECALPGADQDAQGHGDDHDRAARRHAVHRRVHRRRRHQHRQQPDRRDEALALDAASA